MVGHYILVFFLSMIPVLELRFAVPLAVNLGIPSLTAIAVCTIGNMVPVPLIYFFARKVLIWGMDKPYIGKPFTFLHDKGQRAGQKLREKAGRGGLFIALLLFVGIPIPGTGAWTGTLAASFLDMGIKSTAISVSLGVILAGCIMALASSGIIHVFGLF